ncbi:hypothetical protein YC2023_124212 [Brassica napus]
MCIINKKANVDRRRGELYGSSCNRIIYGRYVGLANVYVINKRFWRGLVNERSNGEERSEEDCSKQYH